ncbi:hypothetical protein DFH09DRAFT_1486371 [Mycena vulgaris]|nr:hypothetical protein DFH09DRAFT_1486371 [Mycena vulgaris]
MDHFLFSSFIPSFLPFSSFLSSPPCSYSTLLSSFLALFFPPCLPRIFMAIPRLLTLLPLRPVLPILSSSPLTRIRLSALRVPDGRSTSGAGSYAYAVPGDSHRDRGCAAMCGRASLRPGMTPVRMLGMAGREGGGGCSAGSVRMRTAAPENG